jgi:hypothetical protein
MTSLQQSTERRIKKIPQTPSVWEGDRRKMGNIDPDIDQEMAQNGDCIIWIDGSEGIVRAMDMVSPEQGPEAMVRTLLRAIENPHSPAQPARPQKIVVKDRETQFFLRGALQNLDINIDYAPKLPLIDELFRTLESSQRQRPPQVPPEYADQLEKLALEIWQEGLWDVLADHEIIAIEIGFPEPITVYASVMGMLGQEYGIILYRSLDSLKRFRETVLAEKSVEKLESAFLSQDCWFINFEAKNYDEEDEDFDLEELALDQIQPLFGSLHPYEGMRPFLDEEETIIIYLSLQGLKRFFRDNINELEYEDQDELISNYQISLPKTKKKSQTIPVKVSNLPELSAQLLEMMGDMDDDEDDSIVRISIEDDLIPENSWINFRIMDWSELEILKKNPKIYYHSESIPQQGKGIPVVMVQTSKGKGEAIIEQLKEEGGVKGFSFNPGENSFTDEKFNLGLIQTNQGSLYLLSEFSPDDVGLQEWWEVCEKNNNDMAIIVAMGVTGASKGDPQLKHILGIFETKGLSKNELGIGILQLMPQFDFDFDEDEDDED